MKYKQLVANSYIGSDDLLNTAAEEGWELVTAAVVSGTIIFYLRK